ncbi:hypothetical protein [uncultured Cohaesibacter sp.]|uniref:hypothetical protein n=1 Tax=uncultured Cohaesibacter sp. TaxID=1002546 RepID=UPI0029C87FAF|nr:hypothetical protein [uncultured Cohaesibacter sp.]
MTLVRLMGRWGLAVGLALLMAACAGTQEKVQRSVDRNMLTYVVGKPYQSIASQRKTTFEGLFQDDRAYGEVFSQATLANGDMLYRHLDRYESGEKSSSMFGVVGTSSTQISYRLIYFRVGPDGLIKDTANGFLHGEVKDCTNWVGGIFQTCDDPARMSQTVEGYDNLVLTSSGQPLSSWGL